MHQHGADEQLVIRSEDASSTEDLYSWLTDEIFVVGASTPRWASLCLDGVPRDEQNMLLSLAEQLPENCRLILRATGTSVIPALRSRCFTVSVQPPTWLETVNLLETNGVSRAEAEELAELRPGRPGLALALAEEMPYRNHLGGVLNAVEAQDWTALAAALLECPEGVRLWFQEWVRAALANRPWSHPMLAKQAGTVRLVQVESYLNDVKNPRLAVRAAATILATRQG